MAKDMFEINHVVNKAWSVWLVVINNPNPDKLKTLPLKIECNLGIVLKRKLEKNLSSVCQFQALNQFLDYKGEEFKEQLYEGYWQAADYIERVIYSTDPDIKDGKDFKDYFYKVLDMFDLEEIREFLTNVFKLYIPQNLSARFDKNIEKDNRGFEKQTYLQGDYQNLIDFAILVKATYPLLLLYGSLISKPRQQTVNKEKSQDEGLDYKLCIFYRHAQKVAQCPAISKLRAFTENLYESLEKNDDDKLKISISKNLSSEEIIEHIMAEVILKKISVITITNTEDDRGIVAGFYNYINNKFTPQNIMKNNFKPAGEKDSIIESYRMVMDLPLGLVQTANFYTNSVESIMNCLPDKQRSLIEEGIIINSETYSIERIRELTNNLNNLYIHDNTLVLTGIIFKSILTPKYIDYLNTNNVLNLIALGVSYLFNMGYVELADLYISGYTTTYNDGAITINTTSNKSRVSMDDIIELEKYFPLKKFPNKTRADGELIIKSWVETYCNAFYKHTWNHAFSGDNILIPPDIKIMVSKFLIDHEKLLYGEIV